MLFRSPGEFVVTKKAAEVWGPKTLAALNDPRGTIDPGIFGYAVGGYVRTAEETLAWARSQAGKPYQYPMVGPNSYDCSGFTSALINYILGRNPHSRRHSSGSIGSDPAVAPGIGTPATGFSLGSRPPYQVNSQGALVGHIAATIMGIAAEATPPAVRVGGAARGADSSTFTQRWHLPGFGGLSAADKEIVAQVTSLRDKRITGLTAPLGDLLQQMFNRLPGMIFDFLIKRLPTMIVDGIKEVIGVALDPFGLIPFFGNGGMVRRNGPMLVGEHRPEILWGSRGQYVQAQAELGAGGGVTLNVAGSILGEDDFRRFIHREVSLEQWRQDVKPRPQPLMVS